jgi:hypothetical protein
MFPPLNFPVAQLKINGSTVWDILQKKYVKLTPEEWVRQHTIHFLVHQKGYSKNLMQSEFTVTYNNMRKRCDIVIFNNQLKPIIIVECKAPKIKLSEDTFFQIAKYYATLQAPLLVLTNGIQHIYAVIGQNNKTIQYLSEMPSRENFELLIS